MPAPALGHDDSCSCAGCPSEPAYSSGVTSVPGAMPVVQPHCNNSPEHLIRQHGIPYLSASQSHLHSHRLQLQQSCLDAQNLSLVYSTTKLHCHSALSKSDDITAMSTFAAQPPRRLTCLLSSGIRLLKGFVQWDRKAITFLTGSASLF